MNRISFTSVRKMFHRGPRTPAWAVAGPRFMSRALVDIRHKEYAVFMEPLLNRVRDSLGSRFRRNSRPSDAAEALRALESIPAASSQVSTTDLAPEQMPPPIPPVPMDRGGQDRAGGDELDPGLVEEIFGPSAQSSAGPKDGAELEGAEPGGLDSGGKAAAAVAAPELGRDTNESTTESSIKPSTDAPDVSETGPDGPVETTSRGGENAETDGSESQPAQGTRMRTMVEALPDRLTGEGGLADFLSDDLQDIFSVTNYSNPRTKALLKNRERVDVYELAKELKEHARSMGVAKR